MAERKKTKKEKEKEEVRDEKGETQNLGKTLWET